MNVLKQQNWPAASNVYCNRYNNISEKYLKSHESKPRSDIYSTKNWNQLRHDSSKIMSVCETENHFL